MTTDHETEAALMAAFGARENIGKEILEKLRTLKDIFNLNEDDLFVQWETFNVNKVQENLELSAINLDRFQEYLQKLLSNNSTKLTPSTTNKEHGSGIKRKPIFRTSAGLTSSSPNNILPSTPSIKKIRLGETPFKTPQLGMNSSPISYTTANNTFQNSIPSSDTLQSSPSPGNANVLTKHSHSVLETLNPHISLVTRNREIDEADTNAEKPFRLALNIDPSKYKFRTMSMKLLESADVLDDQVDTMTRLVQEASIANESDFGNPCISSQSNIVSCGRIVPDTPLFDTSSMQPLNGTSLCLETSRVTGIGQRIPLNLENLKSYSFFPGQIVCLKGNNPTGQEFVVQEVLKLPELGFALSDYEELKESYEMTKGSGLKIMILAGPFSNSHTLDFSKFESLIDKINQEIKPHVIIMLGPFIDITNTSVRKGDVEIPNQKYQPKDLDDIFRLCFVPIIKKTNLKIQIVMIPSLKDAASKHGSYPQNSFGRKKFGLPKNTQVFPNPSSFAINEALFGCSNIDIFKHLKDIVKLNPNDESAIQYNNRFERIANHIFDQRRYYPFFPGVYDTIRRDELDKQSLIDLNDGFMREELSEISPGGASLELPYLGLAEIGDTLPDVMICPSELKFFAKVVRGALVINPGYFIRGSRDSTREEGTYAILNVASPDLTPSSANIEKFEGADNLYFHNILQRTRVDIYNS